MLGAKTGSNAEKGSVINHAPRGHFSSCDVTLPPVCSVEKQVSDRLPKLLHKWCYWNWKVSRQP